MYQHQNSPKTFGSWDLGIVLGFEFWFLGSFGFWVSFGFGGFG
jgi:hypothetical protein